MSRAVSDATGDLVVMVLALDHAGRDERETLYERIADLAGEVKAAAIEAAEAWR